MSSGSNDSIFEEDTSDCNSGSKMLERHTGFIDDESSKSSSSSNASKESASTSSDVESDTATAKDLLKAFINFLHRLIQDIRMKGQQSSVNPE